MASTSTSSSMTGNSQTASVASSSAGGSPSTASMASTASGGAGGMGGGGDPCQAPGMLICDDFEAADAQSWPSGSAWEIQQVGQGTVEVDSSVAAHSGTRSIHVHGGDDDYQTMFVHEGAPLPSPEQRLYLRAYLRLAEPMQSGHNTYFKAGYYPDGSGTDPYETRVGVHEQMLDINQQEGDRGYLSNEAFWQDMVIGPGLVAGEWRCVEVLLDHANTEIDVWLESQEIPDLHHLDWLQDDYDTVSFGFEKYAGPATDVWYDDVAISTERIGCW